MKFSIIIPVYNIEANILENCILSVINQSFTDYEVIIVDDGSTENCAIECEHIATLDNRIRVVHQVNKGLSGARNTGIKVSSGQWIIHVDGDDWIKEGCLENLNKFIDETKYDIIVFGYDSSDNGKLVRHELKNKSAFNNTSIIDILKAIMRNNPAFNDLALNTTWGKAFRREFIENSNIFFDERLRRAQDVIYNLQVFSLTNSVGFLDGIYYVYRNDNNSLSRGYNKYNKERMTLTANTCLEFVNKSKYRNELEQSALSFVRGCFISINDTDFMNNMNPYSERERRKHYINTLDSSPYKDAFLIKNIIASRNYNRIDEILVCTRSYYLLKFFRLLKSKIRKVYHVFK